MITERGEYGGGVIAPGIGTSIEALFQRASKLPRVDLTKPPRVIGRNTVSSIQSGVIYGYVSLVDGIVTRMKEEADIENAKVVATGGLAAIIARESFTVDEVDENLTLDGLRMIYELNRGGAS